MRLHDPLGVRPTIKPHNPRAAPHKNDVEHSSCNPQGPLKGGGGSNGGGFPIWTCPSFSVLLRPFWDFPVFFFRDFPDLSGDSSGIFPILGLLTARTRKSPKGSATQSGPFPGKVGNPPVWKPRFSFSQNPGGGLHFAAHLGADNSYTNP